MPAGCRVDEKLPTKVPDVVARKIAGEFLLVPVRGNLADLRRVFSLSPVAEHIWGELDRCSGFNELCSSIVERFEVGEREACSDLREFIEDLLQAGLVTR
jgi:hypothetical protein